jgi:soluble P-type ATPase
MLELDIPGRGVLQLSHLVLDVNGFLALDGRLLDGMKKRIGILSDRFEIHLLTADTHGHQAEIDRQLGRRAVRLLPGGEAGRKAAYVRRLGAESTAGETRLASDLVAPDFLPPWIYSTSLCGS